jgi:SH3-like domain-containing protein
MARPAGTWLAVFALAVATASCGDAASDGDDTTTTVSETTLGEADTTTTTTVAPTTTPRCVVDRAPGEVANVRTAPTVEGELVGELVHDAVVGATGEVAVDDDGDEWREIVFEGEARWVVSRFLTAGECSHAAPQPYIVTGIACGSFLNVRSGPSDQYTVITTLEPDQDAVQGSGVTALDHQDRTWVQVAVPEGVGWVAGWFLEAGAVNPLDCSPPPFPWLITPDAFGPITIGMAYADLGTVTGLSWEVTDSHDECVWVEANGIGVQSIAGVIREIWSLEPGAGATTEGTAVGDTKAAVLLAYGGRAAIMEGPFLDEVIVIDAAAYTGAWSYLFNMTAGDVVLYIRVNDAAGRYIPGGCA